MAILGIYEGHNAGAAVVSEVDGTVLMAVEEERFSRVKNHDCRPAEVPGPTHSVQWCVQSTPEVITRVAIGLEEPVALHRRAVDNFVDALASGELQRLERMKETGKDAYELLQMPLNTQRARVAKALATVASAGLHLDRLAIDFVPHHTCHAAAFFLTSASTASVITLDGKGDDLSGTVSEGRDERLERIAEAPTEYSLGHLYSAATVACGLRPQRDEGKLTALAASGDINDELYERLRGLIQFDPSLGVPRSRLSEGIVQGPYPDRVSAFHNNALGAMIRGLDIADTAATVQQVLEETVLDMATHHLHRSGMNTLVVSGGVFANVSLNRKLAESPLVEALHVHPGMTDSGIALGAATMAYVRNHGSRPRPLRSLGLGPSYSDDEAIEAFRREGYIVDSDSGLPETALAAALAAGQVVARFSGGCEYGPRALGNRSVFAPASRTGLAASLNQRLGRSPIMPFAPITLAGDAADLFHGLSSVREPTRFMTTAVRCTDMAIETIPAAVHLDRTARPQLVDPVEDPHLASLLSEYKHLTGSSAVINTSFNLHDEPIVCAPSDAARSARRARIKVVQVGSQICVRAGSTGGGAEL
jgi:carbamoyltransferase